MEDDTKPDDTKPCHICEQTLTYHEETNSYHGLHLAFCMECEKCERRFHKHDVLVYKLDETFLACEHCGLVESVSYYRLEATKWRDAADTRLLKINLYKTCLMNTETWSAKANDPASDQPSVVSIRQRLTGIENFTIDEFQFMLETFEIYAREIAAAYGKKANKEEIKKHLADKTKKALEEQIERTKKQEKKTKDEKIVEKLTDEQKVIKSFMKMGISESAARGMYEAQMSAMKGIKK